jgi:hypothetical protein
MTLPNIGRIAELYVTQAMCRHIFQIAPQPPVRDTAARTEPEASFLTRICRPSEISRPAVGKTAPFLPGRLRRIHRDRRNTSTARRGIRFFSRSRPKNLLPRLFPLHRSNRITNLPSLNPSECPASGLKCKLHSAANHPGPSRIAAPILLPVPFSMSF